MRRLGVLLTATALLLTAAPLTTTQAAPGQAHQEAAPTSTVVRGRLGDVESPSFAPYERGERTMDASRVRYDTFWEGGRRMFRMRVTVRDVVPQNGHPQWAVLEVKSNVMNGDARMVQGVVNNAPKNQRLDPFRINGQENKSTFTPERARGWVNPRTNEFGLVFSTERFGPFNQLQAKTTTIVRPRGGSNTNFIDPTPFSRMLRR